MQATSMQTASTTYFHGSQEEGIYIRRTIRAFEWMQTTDQLLNEEPISPVYAHQLKETDNRDIENLKTVHDDILSL